MRARATTIQAPKTGPLTGVDLYMTGMGKGNASRGAAQYGGAGVELGKTPVLSTLASTPTVSFGRPPPVEGLSSTSDLMLPYRHVRTVQTAHADLRPGALASSPASRALIYLLRSRARMHPRHPGHHAWLDYVLGYVWCSVGLPLLHVLPPPLSACVCLLDSSCT